MAEAALIRFQAQKQRFPHVGVPRAVDLLRWTPGLADHSSRVMATRQRDTKRDAGRDAVIGSV
jgi:hypothetical protein